MPEQRLNLARDIDEPELAFTSSDQALKRAQKEQRLVRLALTGRAGYVQAREPRQKFLSGSHGCRRPNRITKGAASQATVSLLSVPWATSSSMRASSSGKPSTAMMESNATQRLV